MKPHTKHILATVAVLVVVFIIAEIYKAIKAGVTGLENLLMAPWNALSSAYSSATATVQNVEAGNTAASTIASMNNADYAPGGQAYQQIEATQGQAAADAAWQAVQNHEAVQQSQTVTWNPFTWL